eukprot:scaffold79927_cov30-Phaeocystis_antarctica.AAC.1
MCGAVARGPHARRHPQDDHAGAGGGGLRTRDGQGEEKRRRRALVGCRRQLRSQLCGQLSVVHDPYPNPNPNPNPTLTPNP